MSRGLLLELGAAVATKLAAMIVFYLPCFTLAHHNEMSWSGSLRIGPDFPVRRDQTSTTTYSSSTVTGIVSATYGPSTTR